MTELRIYYYILIAFSVVALAVFITLFFVTAPYGRHTRKGWGPQINSSLAWIFMEAPASLLFLLYFILSPYKTNPVYWVFLLIWESHYIHRAFIFPFRRWGQKTMPVTVMLLGITFNLFNTYIQGRWLFALAPQGTYSPQWLTDPRFIAGAVLFVAGYIINRWADRKLEVLRKNSGGAYAIPNGGLYNLIACPNYFGELVIWIGWAVLTWSLGGAVFVFWTAANLVPRAYSHLKWYRSTFSDFPPRRKAIFPFIF